MTEDEKQYLISGSTMPFGMWKAAQGCYGGYAHTKQLQEAQAKLLAMAIDFRMCSYTGRGNNDER